MKRKILAIVLSLALLSILFVFAAPVSAAPADQADFVDFYIDLGGKIDDVPEYIDRWVGKPGTYEGKDLPGHVRMQWDYIAWRSIQDSTWGAGVAESHWSATDNYLTGKRVVQHTWIFTFDGYEGTIVFNRQAKHEFTSWKDLGDPENYSANWSTPWVHRVETVSTGYFKDFHFVEFSPTQTGSIWYGTGKWSPKSSAP